MKKYLVLLGATVALLLASACGTPDDVPGADPTPSYDPAGSASSSDTPQPVPQCTPVAGGIPGSVKDFECLNLSSVSGSDATGELAWLGTDPFTLVTNVRDGALAFSSKTPCNTVMGPVEVTGSQFIVAPNLAMTMMMCQSPQNDYEGWVVKFFSAPLDYTLEEDALVLSNSHGTVVFKPAAP